MTEIINNIRFVEKEDAEFIIETRNIPRINKFINDTSTSLQEQQKWIMDYKKREENKNEFYFIVSENNQKKGLFRLYNINSISFVVGSWVFITCLNKNLPILSYGLMCEVGFSLLKRSILLYDIRKNNRRVQQFCSLKKNFILYNEDSVSYYYLLEKNNWEDSKTNILNYFSFQMEQYNIFKSLIFKNQNLLKHLNSSG